MKLFANHKTYMNEEDTRLYLDKLSSLLSDNSNIVVFPSSTNLYLYKPYNIKLGLQDFARNLESNNTGEVNISKVEGIDYALVGHSEVRKRTTVDSINTKMKLLIDNNITPVLCVGETLKERETKLTLDIIKKELDEALDNIDSNYIVAYEPIWAIGTNITPTIEEIKEVVNFIKVYTSMPVLYGGSTNKSNIEDLAKSGVDGFLVGGASTKLDFSDMINIANRDCEN